MRLLAGLSAAALLTGCVSIADNSVEMAAPQAPAITGSSDAPDSMRWLYGSGEAAGLSIQAWRAIADYGEAVASGPFVADSVMMGLPEGLAVSRLGSMPCTKRNGSVKPLAFVFDVDETVILNAGYEHWLALGNSYSGKTWRQWEENGAPLAIPVPGAVTGIRRLREAGVTPVFNTNRQYSPSQATEAIRVAGLGEAVHGDTLFLRGDDGVNSGNKDGRRAKIAERFCVIGLAGDNLGDFADVFNDDALGVQARREMAARRGVAQMWGNGWFLLPNPVYGDSITGTIDEVFPPEQRWTPATSDEGN